MLTMACSSHFLLNATRYSYPSPCKFPSSSQNIFQRLLAHSLHCYSSDHTQTAKSFTWDDVLRISQSENSSSSNLQGYFEKVRYCNRNIEKQREFIPFVVEDKIVYTSSPKMAGSCNGPFGCHVTLQPTLETPEDKTSAIGNVIRCLGDEVIPGLRNELYPVTSSFGTRVFFSLERAAAPYFGIKAYGVHMNGYVERDGQQFLWVGRRSRMKPTFPGMLDHLVAGGLPHGVSCGENLIKECEEEAGVPKSISKEAKPVGAISYVDIDGHRFKRDVLFCYDLKLPEDFKPINQDGEVEDFKLIPVPHVANVIRMTQFFKPNCSIVIIDFLFRHGYIRPEDAGYLKLLQSLRSGDCS
ncbi:hypothetical protein Nepgr_022367 [Nepenthes gracilis]|uniref:Nudix hydrolase domain-containing protein n=1 Tax=Nepenthes gracilis TaxID=150966 RepID=A0AAD3T2F8_NEPGR|nr:hypothetical protein Nepgr_022367 [Nepenthes gracilis]